MRKLSDLVEGFGFSDRGAKAPDFGSPHRRGLALRVDSRVGIDVAFRTGLPGRFGFATESTTDALAGWPGGVRHRGR